MKKIISIWLKPPYKLTSKINFVIGTIAKRYEVYGQLMEYKGPHITIFSLECDEDSLSKVMHIIKFSIKKIRPFKVTIKDVGYFIRPYSVLYLKVMKSRKIDNLYKTLNRGLKDYKIGYPKFSPHITIASNKLNLSKDRKKIRLALKEFRNFRVFESFIATEIKVSLKNRKG